MESRRDFIKKAALLTGGAGITGLLPMSIQKALAIDPKPGSTYLDAEHVVLLMQENRSFDHCFGTLRGVRGFNDPRAISLPNENPVWLQTNREGETYAPFRLNIKDSKATWMNSLPHSWENQVDARNNGKYDQWLDVKRSGNKEYAHMPLTLGYYTREDIPFYYALADAFTVCDQHFCSSLTGTTPNRLYFWTGTVRATPDADAQAHVRNEETDYGVPVSWKTFPERLEENQVSWKIYQNEVSIDTGLKGEEDAWLSSFTDNPLEWFTQYNIGFVQKYREHLQHTAAALAGEIGNLEKQLAAATNADAAQELQQKKNKLQQVQDETAKWQDAAYEKLSQLEKNIHRKAFTNNSGDPHYRELTTFTYRDDNGETRSMKAPKGDVLHQFRQDVQNGSLPTVSWLVAPENFSDHPGAPWYGAWYVSEVLDILTQNPEVWKKTIFILTYDENDGCFDHVPPFVAPHPGNKATGFASAGIDTASEFVEKQQELKRYPEKHSRESAIGLGYRVPLVIASPWSRGGWVNSQVFDHTSCLQFLEDFLAKKGYAVRENNISEWRRTVCGNLSSVFRPYHGEKINLPDFLEQPTVLKNIHQAQFKQVPTGYRAFTAADIAAVKRHPHTSPLLPKQEPGTRPSCALPYQLYADGQLSADKRSFQLQLKAADTVFGKQAAGSPFNVYAPGKHLKAGSEHELEAVRTWAYAVKAGDALSDEWPLQGFENNRYHLRVYGPNGFYREFKGSAADPALEVHCEYQLAPGKTTALSGNLELRLKNTAHQPCIVHIKDNAYQTPAITQTLAAAGAKGDAVTVVLSLDKSRHWYDFSVHVNGYDAFEKRYAGRVETGAPGISDPAMA